MQSTLYTVYLLRCADETLYTGVTTDVNRRLSEHNTSAKGAKYTRARRPVRLIYSERCTTRGEAQKREHHIRTLSHAEKEKLATC